MRNATWNPMLQVGNPTKSVPVNVLIKVIKKAEVRRQGKPSEARREIERAECLRTLQILNDNPEGHNCTKRRFMMTAASKFQFSMVAGVDSMCHFEEQDLKPNPDYPASLKTRMGLFTAEERGRNKCKYNRRKVVWETIDRLVRGGRTAQTAIDMTYQTYGHQYVTIIINAMRRDRRTGGHPNLR